MPNPKTLNQSKKSEQKIIINMLQKRNIDFILIDEISDLNGKTSFDKAVIFVGPLTLPPQKLTVKNVYFLGKIEGHFKSTGNIYVSNGFTSIEDSAKNYKKKHKLQIGTVNGNITVRGYPTNNGYATFHKNHYILHAIGSIFDAKVKTIKGNIDIGINCWNATDIQNINYGPKQLNHLNNDGNNAHISFAHGSRNLSKINNIHTQNYSMLIEFGDRTINYGSIQNISNDHFPALRCLERFINKGAIRNIHSKNHIGFVYGNRFKNQGHLSID